VEAEGQSLSAAISSAVAGMYWVITPCCAEEKGLRALAVGEGEDVPVAFARALQKLLIEFDTRGLLGASCLSSVYRAERARVTLEVVGEPFEVARHPQGVEVKAVTHHDLVVDRASRRVGVLFDI
jgi:SHS2 domain-containing protein